MMVFFLKNRHPAFKRTLEKQCGLQPERQRIGKGEEMSLDPRRIVAELKELRALTSDENGARASQKID
jgi:hypothetical protein